MSKCPSWINMLRITNIRLETNKKIDIYIQYHLLSFPQDMEALKRSLALIESKMGQAKSWLKDPHGQPGNWIFCYTLLNTSDSTIFFSSTMWSWRVSRPRRGPWRGCPACDSGRSRQGGRAVCRKREERHPGDRKGTGTNDRPDSGSESPVACWTREIWTAFFSAICLIIIFFCLVSSNLLCFFDMAGAKDRPRGACSAQASAHRAWICYLERWTVQLVGWRR